MKANEFIKEFGFEEAQRVVRKAEVGATIYVLGNVPFYEVESSSDHVVLDDLRHFVESHELVQSKGGLKKAKETLQSFVESCKYGGLENVREDLRSLKKAIADVEACNA